MALTREVEARVTAAHAGCLLYDCLPQLLRILLYLLLLAFPERQMSLLASRVERKRVIYSFAVHIFPSLPFPLERFERIDVKIASVLEQFENWHLVRLTQRTHDNLQTSYEYHFPIYYPRSY